MRLYGAPLYHKVLERGKSQFFESGAAAKNWVLSEETFSLSEIHVYNQKVTIKYAHKTRSVMFHTWFELCLNAQL